MKEIKIDGQTYLVDLERLTIEKKKVFPTSIGQKVRINNHVNVMLVENCRDTDKDNNLVCLIVIENTSAFTCGEQWSMPAKVEDPFDISETEWNKIYSGEFEIID